MRLVYEDKATPKRVIESGNNPAFWDALLQHVRPFPRWSPEAFAAAVEQRSREGTPEDWWRAMRSQPRK